MPQQSPQAELPITHIDDLLRPFHEAFKSPTGLLVGTEAEKIGLNAGDLTPVGFETERGVARVLALLAEKYGWQPQREHAAAPVIALTRGVASITLEPAAQLELSGAPFRSVHDTRREFSQHLAELQPISEELGLVWLSLGFHPFAHADELATVPKLRYPIMNSYMPTRGPRSVDMMRRTCTVQANLDFLDEADAMRKLRIALALQPIVTAMFANSPFIEGRRGEYLSERAAVWLQMDRDRSGMLPFAWNRAASLRDYVEWALDVPMFLVKRGSRVIANTGQTFRSYMRDGAEGAQATLADWESHLNTLFPEARLKRTLEVRGADATPTELLCAVPALWKGLLYDARALDAAERLIEPLELSSLSAARPDIARRALRAELLGRPVQEWAGQVVEIAEGGLERLADHDEAGSDERIYLRELRALVEVGDSPADVLLRRVAAADDVPRAIVAHARV
jgi:glutamate--cysteine ligase